MPLTKEQKQKVIDELKKNVAEQKAIVFFDYSNLKTRPLSVLRNLLKKEKNILKVVKKTLLKLALKEKHSEMAEKIRGFKGQLAVVFGCSDEITLAKLLYRFSQENPEVKILGGFFEGKFQESEAVITLAQLPSRQELLARLTYTLSSPVSGLVNALKGNLKNLVWVLSQIQSQESS